MVFVKIKLKSNVWPRTLTGFAKKTKQKKDAIYFMSTLERHSARKKAPKPTESVEEAALKA